MYRVIFLWLLAVSLAASPIRKEASVVVLGGGIAGMTAALQLSQAGLHPVVIQGPLPGGIITVSPDVENWPSDLSVTGEELASRMEEQLAQRNIELIPGLVTHVDFSKRPLKIEVKNPFFPEDGLEVETQCCIVALGASPNLLQIPGESDLLYKKIFTCAPCDGLRFKNQTVAVIGGGESALVEAQYLANIAKQVVVIVRGDRLKTIHSEKLLSKRNIQVLYQTTVEKFEEETEGLKLVLKRGKSTESLVVQGAFLAIGSRPNTQLLEKSLKLDSRGYIVLKHDQATSVPGVFAAGDVSDPTYRQAITAAGDATKAALQAIHFLSEASISSFFSPTPPSNITEIHDFPTLQTLISSSSLPVVVYFSSPSCPPCRFFKSTYEKWSQDYYSVAQFVKIYEEACPACFDAYNVHAIPSVLIVDSQGKVLQRAQGMKEMSKIRNFLESQKN